MTRVKDKIDEINGFLEELGSITPSSFNAYKSNIEKRQLVKGMLRR